MPFEEPSEAELSAVAELQAKILSDQVQCNLTPIGILRFYRGRKGVMEEAERAIVRHAQWRLENDVDNYKAFDISNEVQKRKALTGSYDRQGRPVVFVLVRRHRTSDRDLDELHRFIISTIEETISNTKPHEQRMVLVFDLANFVFDSMDYEAVKILISVLGYNYPESLEVVHIINEPWIFKACWAIIRAWLDPVTAAKVNFIPQTQLAEHIEESHIPEEILRSLA
jgi:hypothetical protein